MSLIRPERLEDLEDVAIVGAEPASPADGDVWLDTANELWKYRKAGAWVVLGSAGGGSASLSDLPPQPIGETADAGTSTDASRGDHVHAIDVASVEVADTIAVVDPATSASVAHGQTGAAITDFSVGKTGPLGAATDWWFTHDDVAQELSVHLDAAPGAGVEVPFVWAYSKAEVVTPPGPGSLDTVGLVHNLDASTLALSDTDPVTSWPSDVGSLVATAASTGPTYRTGITPNGMPVVRFAGGASRLTLSLAFEPVVGHIFVVGRTSSSALGQILARADSTNRQFRFDSGNNRIQAAAASGSSIGNPLVTGVATNVFYVLELYATASSAACVRNKVEGSPTSHSRSTYALNQIGARGSGSEAFSGDLCQLVNYDVVKSRSEADAIVDHLATKWGVTI